MKSFLNYYGGKNYMINDLLQLIPSHLHYCEVFGGAGWLLFAKDPSHHETYNDIDSTLVNLFHVIQDPQKFKKFYRKVLTTPFSREIFEECRREWKTEDDPVEKAYKFYIMMRMAFNGIVDGSWGHTRQAKCGTKPITFANQVKRLPEIMNRLQRVSIENDTWQKILPRYDSEKTLFYLDPPYVPETRKTEAYVHEMTNEDHRELIEEIIKLKGKVILSGYQHEIYAPLNKEWRRHDFKIHCRSTGKANMTRTESIWCNFDQPQLSLW